MAEPGMFRQLSRRELITGAAAGGAALVATNAVTLIATEQVTEASVEKRMNAQVQSLEGEISLLRRQLSLYKDMERIGLDDLIRAVLIAYDKIWPPIRNAIVSLAGTVRRLDLGLARFETALPTLRDAVRTVRGLIDSLEGKARVVIDIVANVIDKTGPLGDAVAGFLSWLVGRIPLGVNADAKRANDGITDLSQFIPPFLADARQKLLEPLDTVWLVSKEDEGLESTIFTPLRKGILQPLAEFLGKVEGAAGSYENDVATPLRAALDKRDKIRAEVARVEKQLRDV